MSKPWMAADSLPHIAEALASLDCDKLTNGQTIQEALDSIYLPIKTLDNIAHMCCMDCGYGDCEHDIAKTALGIKFKKKCKICSGIGIAQNYNNSSYT